MSNQLPEELRRLRLNYLADNFDEFIKGCDKAKLTAKGVIEKIANLELVEKSRKGTERRLRQAKLGKFKRMNDFDWAFPKKIERTIIDDILTVKFIERSENVILAGAQGLGKTMIAKNIGYQAIMAGKNSLFTTASQLVMHLQSYDNQVDLNRAFRKYAQVDVLIIDELGYLSYDVCDERAPSPTLPREILNLNHRFKSWRDLG